MSYINAYIMDTHRAFMGICRAFVHISCVRAHVHDITFMYIYMSSFRAYIYMACVYSYVVRSCICPEFVCMYVCCAFVHYVCMYVVHSYNVMYIYIVR